MSSKSHHLWYNRRQSHLLPHFPSSAGLHFGAEGASKSPAHFIDTVRQKCVKSIVGQLKRAYSNRTEEIIEERSILLNWCLSFFLNFNVPNFGDYLQCTIWREASTSGEHEGPAWTSPVTLWGKRKRNNSDTLKLKFQHAIQLERPMLRKANSYAKRVSQHTQQYR